MGTKAEPGPHDCYANAKADEPLFVLLARDPHAPELVREWVRRRIAANGAEDAKTVEALEVADAMQAWRAVHPAA